VEGNERFAGFLKGTALLFETDDVFHILGLQLNMVSPTEASMNIVKLKGEIK